jgi:hypothetical protein
VNDSDDLNDDGDDGDVSDQAVLPLDKFEAEILKLKDLEQEIG